jgi:hypothetical protein
MNTTEDELLARLFRAGKRAADCDAPSELPLGLVNRVVSRWASSDSSCNEIAIGFLVWRMGLACALANLIVITSLWLAMPSTSGAESIVLFLPLP